MYCPICCEAMRPLEYEGAEVHSCNTCGGEFLKAEAMREVVTRRDTRFPQAMRDALATRTPMHGAPVEASARHLSCPGCTGSMSVINYGNDTGIFVDRCDECGSIWTDRAELEQIQVLSERWNDESSYKLRQIADELETSRREVAETSSRAFAGSRFAFINAIINRIIGAA